MSFPNQLASAKPARWALPPAGATLVFLFLLCLGPRAVTAWRLETLCPDGAFYLQRAQRLESGAQKAACDQYDLNVYLLLLTALHRGGLDWNTAAKVWGVLAGSLAVLPLFGWARRMFDDRIALLAGLLYAAHPKLIEWSPETMREATFWLLFTLAVYSIWRAVSEVQWKWFIAGGAATFLAVNTRFEGWFLVIPLVGWSFWRMVTLRQHRGRLCGGVALFAACYPAMMALLIYCHGYERWEWGNFDRLQLIVHGLSLNQEPSRELSPSADTQDAGDAAHLSEPRSLEEALAMAAASSQDTAVGRVPSEPTAGVSAIPRTEAARQSAFYHEIRTAGLLQSKAARVTRVVAEKVGAGFTPLFGVLTLIGLLRWWRLWLRPDHVPLVFLGLVTIAGMWFHATAVYLSSTRYVLPLVILATPLAGLGILPLCRGAANLASRAAPRRRIAPYLAATAALLLVFFAGTVDALTSRLDGATAKAELGRWLRQQAPAPRVVVGSSNWKLVEHYADAAYHPLPTLVSDVSPASLQQLVIATLPEFVVLCQHSYVDRQLAALIDTARAMGLEPLAVEELPPRCRGRVIVLRRPATCLAAQTATPRK